MSGERGPGAGWTYLFVYGTLRSGAEANERLRGCVRVGPATVRGTLYDIDGEFPALVLAGTDAVHGEIWRCPARRLYELDEYEGVPERLFRRVALEVDGLPCWTYVAGGALAIRLSPQRRVPGGEWPPRE